MNKHSALLLIATLWTSVLAAQQTTIYTEANRAFKRGADFQEQGLLGQAQDEFKTTLDLLQPVNEPEADMLRTKAEFNYAKCAVQRKLPEGEKLIGILQPLIFLKEKIRSFGVTPLAGKLRGREIGGENGRSETQFG